MTLERLDDLLRRGRPWWILALLLALALIYGNRAALRPDSDSRGDTRFYQRAAQRFARGEPLYYDRVHGDPRRDPVPTTGYTYLPPFAAASVWMLPLPYRALRVVWLLAMLACAAVALALAPRVAGATARPHVAGLLAGLLALRFGLNDLAHGQVNWLITLLLLASLEALRRERDLFAGAVLALALLIKPTTWLLVPWLALTRRWRAAGACVGVALGALLLTGLRYGPSAYAAELSDWFLRMRRFAGEAALDPDNAGLASTLTRLGADPLAARWLAVSAVGAAFAALAWRRRQARDAPAAVIVLCALLSPVTWKAHLATLLIPGACLGRRLTTGDAGRASWVGFAALWAALTLPAHQFLGADGFERAGGITWALVILVGWLAIPRPTLVAGEPSDASTRTAWARGTIVHPEEPR